MSFSFVVVLSIFHVLCVWHFVGVVQKNLFFPTGIGSVALPNNARHLNSSTFFMRVRKFKLYP